MPILGVVPDEPYLARPSLIDLEKIFKTTLLAGLENRRQPHYSIKHTHLAATGVSALCVPFSGIYFSILQQSISPKKGNTKIFFFFQFFS